MNSESVTLTYTPYSTNAGTYVYSTNLTSGRYTISINDSNYVIASAGDFTLSNATITYTASGYTGTYDGQGHSITVNVTTPSAGYSVTYSTSANGSFTSTNPSYSDTGSYTVYFRITANNYTTITDSRTIVINRLAINVPTAITGLTYNGQTQTGVNSGTGYMITGNTGVNANSYTATATLNGNYIWSDNSTDVKSISWSIAKCELTISAHTVEWTGATSYTRPYSTGVNNETITLTYTPYSANVGTYTYATSVASGSYTLSLNSNNYIHSIRLHRHI